MVPQIPGIPSHYIIKAHIGVLNNLILECLTVVTEEDGTVVHTVIGTQVIHATLGVPTTDEEDPITDGGHITNGIW